MKRTKNLLLVFGGILCICVLTSCSNENVGGLSAQGVSPEIPYGVVELGIVCDKEFAEAFGYDEDRITEYIKSLVEGLEVDFQTLQSIKISFAITSIITLKNASAQPFIESKRNDDGTTELADIQWSFMLWLYKSRIANISDIVILLTGSTGVKLANLGVPDFLCKHNDDTKTFDSVVVMRSSLHTNHTQNDFTVVIANMLGAKMDANTACNETAGLMSETYNPSTQHYFSTCSDHDIYQTLQSAECIKETDASKYDKAILSSKRRKLSLAEQCRLRFSNYQNVTTDTIDESCHTTRCIENKPDGLKYLGNIFPLHGTPCGENKVCFRGSCTNKRSLPINAKFESDINVSSSEPDLDFKNQANSTSIGTLMFVAVSILITLIAVIFIIKVIKLLYLQRQFKNYQNSTNYEWLLEEDFYHGNMNRYNPELDIAEQVELLPFDKSWEFPVERLTIGKLLGSGAFATVFKAKAEGILESQTMSTVAVKIISATDSSNHFSALKSELKVLCHLGRHINVVNLLGACTKDFNRTKKLYMIIEYCKFGNLRNFLLSNRHLFVNNVNNLELAGPHQSYRFDVNGYQDYDIKHRLKSINTLDIILWAFQIAKGMEYLASKRVLHGDLTARNVLLAENNIVKICDFGFSKELSKDYNYNYKKCMEVPYKWMAVESVMYGLFSSQSDCWSFGVVLWELFSLGDSPYPGLEMDESFFNRINTGYRMEKPLYAPSRLYDIMLQCWSHDPNMRPKFSYLAELLGSMLGKTVADYYAKQRTEFEIEGLLQGQGETSFMFPTLGESAIPEDSTGYLLAVPLSQSSGEEHDTGTSAACRLLENGQSFMFVKE